MGLVAAGCLAEVAVLVAAGGVAAVDLVWPGSGVGELRAASPPPPPPPAPPRRAPTFGFVFFLGLGGGVALTWMAGWPDGLPVVACAWSGTHNEKG